MEQTRSKLLLHSMLPVTVVNQLKAGRQQIADEFIEISVLFAEVCDFDAISCALQPSEVVEMLNTIFSTFDQLVDVHGVHKVETIGAVRPFHYEFLNSNSQHARYTWFQGVVQIRWKIMQM